MKKNKNYKISIITVVKNSLSTIEKTIRSVINQDYKNIEYIIIDGNSTDGTSKIIDKYKDKISIIVREKDLGIWDAMNKGIKLTSGDIVGFLNSGDIYYENTFSTVNKYFNEKNIDFLFGSVQKYKLLHGFRPNLVRFSFGFYTSHSVGFFIKTDIHKKIGFYNLKYLSADLDLFYKMIVKNKFKGTCTKKSEIFGKFAKGGFSSKVNYIDHLKDLNQIRVDNGQNIFFVNLLYFIKIIKKPTKFLKAYIEKKN